MTKRIQSSQNTMSSSRLSSPSKYIFSSIPIGCAKYHTTSEPIQSQPKCVSSPSQVSWSSILQLKQTTTLTKSKESRGAKHSARQRRAEPMHLDLLQVLERV